LGVDSLGALAARRTPRSRAAGGTKATRISLYRPRSIIRLILIGFAVVLAPLIAAVVSAIVQVDRLARDSRAALMEAEMATQQSRSLVEQLNEMERRLGLFTQVFPGDADFHDQYLAQRAIFRNAVDNLSQLSLTKLGREQL